METTTDEKYDIEMSDSKTKKIDSNIVNDSVEDYNETLTGVSSDSLSDEDLNKEEKREVEKDDDDDVKMVKKPKSKKKKRYEEDDEYEFESEDDYDDEEYDCVDESSLYYPPVVEPSLNGGFGRRAVRRKKSSTVGGNSNHDSKYIALKDIFVDPVERDLYTLKIKRHLMSYDPLYREKLEIPQIYPCQLPCSFSIPILNQTTIIHEKETKVKDFPRTTITKYENDYEVDFEDDERYIKADPFKYNFHNKYFPEDIDCVYCSPEFERKGFDYSKFEKLPLGNDSKSILKYGHFFVWVPQSYYGRVYKTALSWGFEYIEQCTWVKLNDAGAVVTIGENLDPLKQGKPFNESCLTLYAFRKGEFIGRTEKKNKRKEKAHQRIPDVCLDFQSKGLPHRYTLNLINKLLPNSKSRLWLWGDAKCAIPDDYTTWCVMVTPKAHKKYLIKKQEEDDLRKRMKSVVMYRYPEGDDDDEEEDDDDDDRMVDE